MSMAESNVSRRDALNRLLKACAVAAGLSAAQTNRLLAQARSMRSLPEVARLIGVPTRDNKVKALKVLLMPKSRKPEVFKSEFGREPQFAVRPLRSGGTVCGAYIGGQVCADLECGVHVCSAATSRVITAERMKEIRGAVNNQECITHCWFCFDFCFSSSKWGAELGSDWLNQVKNDRFIQALFKEFKVTSADDLGRELRGLLQKRQAEL
ncbi:MAG: hypothetical protein KA243_06160 [Candidatus Aminicenantes bacterium]|nr:hypothetical protein [Candidatus Aminicenantes bacterium]